MPARRKPTAVLEAAGAFRKNPKRAKERANEPVVDTPLGPPPERFLRDDETSRRLLLLWNELVAQAPEGVLTSADRWLVESACRLKMEERYFPGSFKSADRTALIQMLGKMAMTPADRSKSQGVKKPNDRESSWAAIAEEARAARPN